MASVNIGFKACDAHELACHFVACHAGLYRRHGLQIALIDTTFVPDAELPPRTFHAACGAALLAWLDGADVRVVFVAAERPMFSLYVRPGLDDLESLRGGVVAGFPAPSPPAIFLRTVLRQRSIDPEDVTTLPARDDVARIGLLRDGSAAAALISSAVTPRTMLDLGFGELLSLGEVLQVPTTGLAVAADTLATEPELVATMRSCYRDALTLIHEEPGVLEAALAQCVTVGAVDPGALAERVRHSYTRNGRVVPAGLDAAIALLAAELGIPAARPAETLYELA